MVEADIDRRRRKSPEPENECFHPLHQDQDQLDCSQKVGVVLVQTFLNMRRVNGNA